MEIWVKTWKWLAGIRRLRWENNALKQRHFSPRSTQAMATHRSHIHLLMQCPWVKLMLSSATMSCLKTTSKTSTTWESLEMREECILASIMDIVLNWQTISNGQLPFNEKTDFFFKKQFSVEHLSLLNTQRQWVWARSFPGRDIQRDIRIMIYLSHAACSTPGRLEKRTQNCREQMQMFSIYLYTTRFLSAYSWFFLNWVSQGPQISEILITIIQIYYNYAIIVIKQMESVPSLTFFYNICPLAIY